ncbi:UvrD-helicase domain-containing protein (plasmid) [Trichlorobacter lovleyi]|uniref:UvrD-helicase domain-containing protein n=1 Tax=Trichlorobacter lovleyi TaxID=313985 RepID=UPI0022409B21|nr:UvrD-helicase domain-containing protein [Trichlorobacter lovleyi]QOX80936.1 UvrD-helicase domain-containing protein [Trichlorobacter lovleyi]
MEKIGLIGLGVAVSAFAYGGLQFLGSKKQIMKKITTSSERKRGDDAIKNLMVNLDRQGLFEDIEQIKARRAGVKLQSVTPVINPVQSGPNEENCNKEAGEIAREAAILTEPQEDFYEKYAAKSLDSRPATLGQDAVPPACALSSEEGQAEETKSIQGCTPEKLRSPVEDDFASNNKRSMDAILVGCGRERPTESQWNVIISGALNSRVIAGAGSGKSTCLSLRVVYMHKYLNIPLDQITVVTFTKASRKDFIEKLTRDFNDFGISASPWVVKSIVRTFHSLLISQSMPAGGGAGPSFFEQQGEPMPQGEEAGGIVADPGALNPRQMSVLRQVFADCFYSDPEFKRIIIDLMMLAFDKPHGLKYEDSESLEKAIAVASKRDQLLATEINRIWSENLRTGIPGVEWEISPIKNSRGDSWHANGRIKDSGVPIILGNGGLGEYAGQIANPIDSIRNFGFINTVRLKVLSAISTEHYLYIENKSDLARLQSMLAWCDGALSEQKKLPAFEVHLAGERKPYSIFELLYKTASFILSMGIDVVPAAQEIAARLKNEESAKMECHVCLALAHFWPVFTKSLQSMEMTTYDELFLHLSERENILKFGLDKFKPMANLLIDEFQDISGQIVRWVIGVQETLRASGITPSLMAVGDDWQSVYGWRGSDPDFLINFERYFPEPATFVMPENFRSGQMVIDAAEVVVSRVLDRAVSKHGVSQVKSPPLPAVFMGIASDDDIKRLVSLLVNKNPLSSIFILSRTNEGLIGLSDLPKQYKGVALHTLHRSKGLESDYVIIKGDCVYRNRNLLFRCRLYTTGNGITSMDYRDFWGEIGNYPGRFWPDDGSICIIVCNCRRLTSKKPHFRHFQHTPFLLQRPVLSGFTGIPG